MMIRACHILLFVLSIFIANEAEASGPCDAPEARQFDFWLGDWNIQQKILDADGTWLELLAKTHVEKDLEGCALVEHWEGRVQFFWEGMKEPELMHGFSVRAFDPETKQWRIYWMDTRHPKFGTFEGGFKDSVGTFLKSSTGSDGKLLLTRITFSDITPQSVTWTLAISRDNGKHWQPLWIMEMKRASSHRKGEQQTPKE